MATTSAGPGVQLERLLRPLGRYDGRALIAVGMAVIVISAMRFVRIQRLLDDQANHSAGGVGAELALLAAPAIVVAGLSAYLVLGSWAVWLEFGRCGSLTGPVG
jgi:putative membrane protein